MALYKDIVKKISIPADKKIKRKDYISNGILPIIDQGQDIIGGYTNDQSKTIECTKPVIVFGDHTKCVKLINFDFGAGADGIKIIIPKNDATNIKYLFYGTQYLVMKIRDKGYARHYQYIEKQGISLPSLHEQKQIVSRIEELFSSLDHAVEMLNKIKAQLAVYRQAVLKEAFSKSNQYVALGDISTSRLGKMLDKSKNVGVYRPYLRNINVRWFTFDLSDLSEMRVQDSEIEKYSIHKGDLVICEGGEPGRCAVWQKDEDAFFQKALHRVRFIDGSMPEFYMYYLWFATNTGILKNHFTGTGIKHLTGESLAKVMVPKEENSQQKKLVEEIESRLSVCDSIERTVDEALNQANAMRQSILKEAFEGRLS